MARPEDLTEQAAETVLAEIAEGAAAQAATENFPVALRVVPSKPRAQLQAVYRFARFVDDIGDEARGGQETRLQLLDLVERDIRLLDGSAAGRPALTPVAEMAPIVHEAGVPIQTLCDLVEANRIDQRVTEYETFDDLLHYCDFSAAPIGRMVLGIAGAATDQNIKDSDIVCSALQVLEHCQDIGEDARRGRIYLPQTELRMHHVDLAELSAPTTSPQLRAAVLSAVDEAERMLDSGIGLLGRLHGWARLAVAGYFAGGYETARALKRSMGEVLATPVRPGSTARIVRAVRLAVLAPRSNTRNGQADISETSH
jgi:squalene synthase HpnC